MSLGHGGKISVSIRLRPLNERERETCEFSWNYTSDTVELQSTLASLKGFPPFSTTCDKIFGPEIIENMQIYQSAVKELVEASLEGINATVFAYGQTSAGKTFTMFGGEGNPGVIYHSLRHIFAHSDSNPHMEYSFRISYLEIYNETIKDLLNPSQSQLKIHESLTRGVFVGNLSEEPVNGFGEAWACIQKGEEQRHVGETNFNDKSSRSHALVRLSIESREKSTGNEQSRESNASPIRSAVLTFVDLAGSEKAKLTGAEGQRLKEGGHINKSLLALTTVVSKLAEGGDRLHIPYRDSKLTRILQASLGGNTKTAILCAITPASDYIEETISTLKFAGRAKVITTKPKVNEIIPDREIIRRLTLEVDRLKDELRTKDGDNKAASEARPAKKAKVEQAAVKAALISYSHQFKELRSALLELERLAALSESSYLFSLALMKSKFTGRSKIMQSELKYAIAEAYANQEERTSISLKAGKGDTVPVYELQLRETLQELRELEMLACNLESQTLEHHAIAENFVKEKSLLQDQLSASQQESNMLLEKDVASQKELRGTVDMLSLVTEERDRAYNSIVELTATADLQAKLLRNFEEESNDLIAQLQQRNTSLTASEAAIRELSSNVEGYLAEIARLSQEVELQRETISTNGKGSLELLEKLLESEDANRELQSELEALKLNRDDNLAVILRIELEKLKETCRNDRRRLELVISDLRDELERLRNTSYESLVGRAL